MADIHSFREVLRSLATKFDKDKNHYLQKGYPEAQVRIDFLNPLFEALGWDIENKARKPPHERDVIVELHAETSKRPDYNFLKLDPSEIKSMPKNARDVRNIGHFGTGDFELTIRTLEEAEAAREYIKMSFEWVGA